jgi:protein-disulfide isomerase
MHPHAQLAAEAALAAQGQDKFWPMHDQLFANARRLSPETIETIAQGLGLDMVKFRSDLKSAKLAQAIKKDMSDGDKAQVDSTPTVFINGKRFNGPLEMVVLKPLLDAELKAGK